MRGTNVTEDDVEILEVFDSIDELFDHLDDGLEGEAYAPARIRVRVANSFHQYKRGDDLIVDDTDFTRALLKNGTFVEGEV